MILLAACVREAHVTGAPDAAPFTLASNPQAVMPIKQAFAKSKPRWNLLSMRHPCNWFVHIESPRNKAPPTLRLEPQRQSSGRQKPAHGDTRDLNLRR